MNIAEQILDKHYEIEKANHCGIIMHDRETILAAMEEYRNLSSLINVEEQKEENLQIKAEGMADVLFMFYKGEDAFANNYKHNWTLEYVKRKAKEALETYWYDDEWTPERLRLKNLSAPKVNIEQKICGATCSCKEDLSDCKFEKVNVDEAAEAYADKLDNAAIDYAAGADNKYRYKGYDSLENSRKSFIDGAKWQSLQQSK